MNNRDGAADVSEHYDSKYFKWQAVLGEFGGWASLAKFRDYIRPEFKVLDFGCGGGYLLQRIECSQKCGIEVNSAARDEARIRNITVFASAGDVEDDWADLIISNSALEHTLHPLQELRNLRSKLIPGGRIVFNVPCESIRFSYKPGDINHHLYSWSPMSIANLFGEAGFQVEESKPYIHIWPPGIWRFSGLFVNRSRVVFDLFCRFYGFFTYLNLTPMVFNQIRIVAKRPATDA